MTRWGVPAIPTWALLAVAVISVVAAGVAERRPHGSAGAVDAQAFQAATLMAESVQVIARARQRTGRGFTVDDRARTGLIGLRDSPITTSVGVLSAKRTATNPNWAAVVVHLLREAGVKPGDVIAAGFSGSFPGLNLATVAAAEALHLRLFAITAVGASNWGANDPDFTWLDMEDALRRGGFEARSLAASVGGVEDAGTDLLPESIQLIRLAIARAGIPLIEAPSLKTSITRRMQAYDAAAGGEPIRVFVSVGGAQANLGRCEQAFFLNPGIHHGFPPCPEEEQGVAHLFAARGVPVINLLNIRSLALAYGLPLDPTSLPMPVRTVGAGGKPDYVPALLFAATVLMFGVVQWASRTGRLPRA